MHGANFVICMTCHSCVKRDQPRSNVWACARNGAGITSFDLKNPACGCDDDCVFLWVRSEIFFFTLMKFIGDNREEEEELMTWIINVLKGLVKNVYGGWAGAFRNVLVRKHMTHPFQLEQNGVTHPPIRHGIFGSIIRKNHILWMKLWCYLHFRFIF